MGASIFSGKIWVSTSAQLQRGCLRHKAGRVQYVCNKKQGPQVSRAKVAFSRALPEHPPNSYNFLADLPLCPALAGVWLQGRRGSRDPHGCPSASWPGFRAVFSAPPAAADAKASGSYVPDLFTPACSPALQFPDSPQWHPGFSPLLRSQ